jgi:sodium-dependent phosphate cotransporter
MRQIALTGLVVGLVYLFLISIGLIGASFKLFGRDWVTVIFGFTSSEICGLFIGILTTSLVQSSSLTTSIVVGMVGGGTLTIAQAVPIVMGANIGTSVTNTLVSVGHVARGNEFRRAFAAAVVHDFFNILSVAILFPLQYYTGFLSRLSEWISTLITGTSDLDFESPLKVIIDPTLHAIKWLLAQLFASPTVQAGWMLALAAVLLFVALKYLTRVLRGVVMEKASGFFQRTLFRTPLLAFVVGVLLTASVQSSSITTSLVVPLAGAGVLTLAQIYPYTLGANVGTTITALLASLAATEHFHAAVAVALSHLAFNICGILVILPLRPVRLLPIRLAEALADQAAVRRWIPFVFVIVVYFVIPLALIFLFR